MTPQTKTPVEADVPTEFLEALGLPLREDLGDSQARGAICVWCRTPVNAWTAVELGEQMTTLPDTSSPARWFPRACTSCVAGRADRACTEHTASCEQCAGGAECEIGSGLAQLAKEYPR